MKSFEPGFLESQRIPLRLLGTMRLLGEYKGKEELYKQQTPQALETLRQVAVIQSTESSNRIEGIVAPPNRLRQLMQQKTTPRSRSEQEIAGYRDVLNNIHANHTHMPFSPNLVLQLHRDLYQFLPQEGGRWKATDNEIVELTPNGSRIVRFTPVSASSTAAAMNRLHERFDELWRQGDLDPLLLIASYILDLLCIHPFADGNGRMARLLTLLLLYKAGYGVGRYISLERIIEEHKEGYYDTLYRSSQSWHEGRHQLMPWWEYFLGVVLLGAYREFEERMKLVHTARGTKTTMVLDLINRLPGDFSISDLRERCPHVGVDLIRRLLRREREAGRLVCLGRGPEARWRRI